MSMRRLFRDPYAAPTPSRRRAGIGLGLLLVLATGFALGKGTAGSAPHPPAAGQATPAPPVAALPTAPAHGPAPQTQAGAITAAAETDCTLGGALVTSPAQYQTAIEGLLTPDKRGAAASIAQAEAAQVDSETGAISAAAQGGRVYISCIPLGYRVDAYAPTTAAVSVWSEQIVAIDQGYAPASAYVTETLHLRWVDGAWKLEGSELLDTQWAPTPREPSLPQASTLPAQLVNFTAFGAG
jgi:hypothetical protein